MTFHNPMTKWIGKVTGLRKTCHDIAALSGASMSATVSFLAALARSATNCVIARALRQPALCSRRAIASFVQYTNNSLSHRKGCSPITLVLGMVAAAAYDSHYCVGFGLSHGNVK